MFLIIVSYYLKIVSSKYSGDLKTDPSKTGHFGDQFSNGSDFKWSGL